MINMIQTIEMRRVEGSRNKKAVIRMECKKDGYFKLGHELIKISVLFRGLSRSDPQLPRKSSDMLNATSFAKESFISTGKIAKQFLKTFLKNVQRQ